MNKNKNTIKNNIIPIINYQILTIKLNKLKINKIDLYNYFDL